MLVGAWGIYNWFEEDGEELIQKLSREAFRNLKPVGKLFQCVGIDGEYIEILYNKQKFKVKPELFIQTPNPTYKFGDNVRLKSKEIIGIICDINWHSKEAREMYFIEVNGKKKSTRYFSEELLIVEGA
ncbi:DUF6960 family protein [Paenibacillus sp. IITD108]|uniref:DUF6960 family protein n=1 Tax=Paenibacillus sp. IITD108 TaxID=3116649 RepID=UPI002F4025F5